MIHEIGGVITGEICKMMGRVEGMWYYRVRVLSAGLECCVMVVSSVLT